MLAPLLDLPVPDRYPPLRLSPERQRSQLIATIVAWISATARQQHTVFVVEDLHWVDPSTLEILTLLGERGATLPLLIVFTARPVFRPSWPPQAHHASVTLNELTRQEVGKMITHLAAQLLPSTQVFETLLARTGGIPLFVEELVRMLIEARPAATGIPETLQDSLMARLDRLGPAKQVAQLASVIGRRFSYELVRGIAQRSDAELQSALGALADAALIYAEGVIPETTYLFKHALIQEAAYASLLKRRRTELHRTVADCLATQFPTLAKAQPELVAEHYTAAALVPQALRWWQTAGERASERAAHAEAIKHYGTALELLAGLPGDATRDRAELGLRVSLGLSLASSHGYAAPEVEQNYRRAHELCQRLGETAEIFQVVRGSARSTSSATTIGYPDQAAQQMGDALALARRLGSPFSLAYCYTYAATATELRRELARSAKYSRAAIQISTDHGFDVLRCAGTLHSGIAKGALARRTRGSRSSRRPSRHGAPVAPSSCAPIFSAGWPKPTELRGV